MTEEQLARSYEMHIPQSLQPQSYIDDWYFSESEHRYCATPQLPPITRKEIMEKANKAELLKMKQDVDNRAARITKTYTRPQTTSTPSTQQRHNNGFPPRSDIPLTCFSCGGPHLAQDCLGNKKPNNYQSTTQNQRGGSKTNPSQNTQFKGGNYGGNQEHR